MTKAITNSTIHPDILNQHTAVLGKTGSGKTYAAKGLVEGLLEANAQVCIIDPTSAWWGLRLGKEGTTHGGYPLVILGGSHGDLPLLERSGAAVARLVTDQRASVILDTSLMGVGESARWFTDFAQALYAGIRAPLHMVIDEAHTFAPQGKVPDPQAGRMLHAANRLLSGGRSRGIRAMLITQRPAKLHKDSLTCVDTLISMRMIAPQDRQAVKDWIDGAADAKAGKQVLDSLASLQRGEGWVWYPEGGYLERVKFPRITTYDSSKTPEGATNSIGPGSIDLDEVKAAMEEAVREAEANDPKLLRARIAELEQKMKLAPEDQSIRIADLESLLDLAHQQIRLAQGERDVAIVAIQDLLRRVQSEIQPLRDVADRLSHTVTDRASITLLAENEQYRLEDPRSSPPDHVSDPGKMIRPMPKQTIRQTVDAVRKIVGTQDLPGPHRKILESLSRWAAMGNDAPTVAQTAVGAGYAASGSFDTYLSRLGTAGMIVRERGVVKLTEQGRAAAPPMRATYSLDQHLSMVFGLLDGPQTKIIRALIDSRRKSVPVEELARMSGYQPSGSFDTYLSRLGTKGFIVRARGSVSPTSLLFPEGLR